MNEAMLKSALMRHLRDELKTYVCLRHEDRVTSGIPDTTVTGRGKTLWLEVKHANPGIRTRGIQELTCLRLATHGLCYYVLYREKNGQKETFIVDPRQMNGDWEKSARRCDGWDHGFVLNFVREML